MLNTSHRNPFLAFEQWIWHETAVPIFIERFVLPIFVALIVVLAVTNPMAFDTTQRISGAVAIVAAAFFLAHTLHRANKAPRDIPIKWEPEAKPTLPEVVFLVQNGRLELNNQGKKPLEIWGSRLASGVNLFEKSPAVLPVLPYNYWITLSDLEKQLYEKVGRNGESRFSVFFFIKDEAGRQLTLECAMWAVITEGVLSIQTQAKPPVLGWPEEKTVH